MPTGAIARLGDDRLRHGAEPECVLFSTDGNRLISGGRDNTLRVWDVKTGLPVRTVSLPDSPISLAALVKSNGLVVNLAGGRTLILNAQSLQEVSAFGGWVGASAVVSPDGKYVAQVAPDGIIVTERQSDLPQLELGAGEHLTFHPDGKSITVAGEDGKVTTHLLAGGKTLFTCDHGGPLNGLAFSPDGKRFATGGRIGGEEVLKVWEVGKTKPVHEIKGVSKPRCWLSDRSVAAANDTGAGVFDLQKKTWAGFAQVVSGSWAVSPDGTKLAATGNGGFHIRLWDLSTGTRLHTGSTTYPETTFLKVSTGGMEVFGLSSDRAFNWTIESTREARFNQLPDRALAAAQNGKHLAVVTPEAVLLYEDFAPTKPFTAKPVRSFTGRFRGGQSVALSAKGTLLAYTDEQNWITIVSTATGTTKNSLLLPSNVLGLAFTPDGEKVVAVGRDGFLRLFSCDTQSGMKSDLWKARVQRAPKAAVAVSPDGRLIAATSATEVLVVTATDGKTAFALGRVHLDDGPFHLVAFSPDGRLLVTGSRGMTGAIQVWEVATRTLVRRFVTHSGAVQTFDVSTDGSRIVSAGAEEAITLWDLSFRKGKSTPSHEELMAAWNELDSPEGEKGYAALRVLVAGGKKGVEVLENGINVSEIVRREKRVAQWVKDLSSEDETTRERASKSLLEAGVRARAALEVVEATTSSDEIRLRASKIIEKLSERSIFVPDHGLVGDTLRLVRAVQVLEDVGGSESQRLLGEIATMGGRPGEDAAAALKRMRPR